MLLQMGLFSYNILFRLFTVHSGNCNWILFILLLCLIHWLILIELEKIIFWWNLCSFLHISSCHLQTDNTTSSFPIWCLLFLFLAWLLWLGLPEVCWMQVLKVSILPLFLILRKAFSLSSLNMIFTVGFLYMAFIMFRKFTYIPSLLSIFMLKVCCILSNAFSS